MHDNTLEKITDWQIKGVQLSPNTSAEGCIIGAKLYKLRCKLH